MRKGTTQVERALKIVARKYFIFPITPNEKNPPLLKWKKESSRNPEIIKAWWKKWPDANIGIDCEKSKLVVLDLDLKPGKNGLKAFNKIETAHEKTLPKTLVATTPSGGLHLYMRGLTKSSNGNMAPGIDVKSIGGYVVAPGSHVDGRLYEWKTTTPTCVAPKWFKTLADKEKNVKKTGDLETPAIDLDQERNIKWAVRFLREDAQSAIQGAGGEFTTLKVSMHLKDRGISLEMAQELMFEHYNERCQPPWDLEEMKTKIENGFRYSSLDAPGAQNAEADFNSVPLPEVGSKEDLAEREKLVPAVYKEWIWIAGIKSFVRKKDLTTWGAKSFDSMFNYIEDTNELSKKIFKSNTMMKKYENLCYEPHEPEVIGKDYNMWKPSKVKPEQGDVSWFKEHLMYLVDNREKEYKLLTQYLAWCIQKPKDRLNFVLILQGGQGIGKSFLGEVMKKILGAHNVAEPSNEEMHGRFNSWAKHVQFCVIHELMDVGKMHLSNKMKSLITEPEIRIEEKGKDMYTVSNKMNFLIFSNHENAILLEADDRRYLVIFSEAISRSGEYYTKLFGHLKHAGRVLDYLMKVDLSDFNGKAQAPNTDDKDSMKELGFNDIESTIHQCWKKKLEPFDKDLISLDEIRNMLLAHGINTKHERSLNTKIQLFLKKTVRAMSHGQSRVKMQGTTSRFAIWSLTRHEIYSQLGPAGRAEHFKKERSC